MSGLTEVQVLCALLQKESSERQSDRQEIDLLGWDARERCKQAGKEALPPGSGGLQFYHPRGVGVRKDRLFLFLPAVAHPLLSGKVCIQVNGRAVPKLLPLV